MLTVGPNLSGFTLAAGEPFLLWLALQEVDGSATSLTGRAFVLSFFKDDRTPVAKIDGEVSADGTFLRFEEDGTFCDGMFNQVVNVELNERLRLGHNRIAGGRLTVTPSAAQVASLDNGPIGEFVVRVVAKKATSVGDKLAFSQSVVAYVAPGATPTPAVTTKPTIGTDGTPQVGETMTGQSGTYTNGSVSARAWLLGGTAISGATGASYVPQQAGALVYRETITGAGGQITSDSDPVTVAAAATTSPAPTPAKPAATFDSTGWTFDSTSYPLFDKAA